MEIKFDINYYHRTLITTWQDGYESYRDEILSIMNDAYNQWLDLGSIVDDDEYAYIHDCPIEEYIINCVEEAGYTWIEEWTSVEWEEV